WIRDEAQFYEHSGHRGAPEYVESRLLDATIRALRPLLELALDELGQFLALAHIGALSELHADERLFCHRFVDVLRVLELDHGILPLHRGAGGIRLVEPEKVRFRAFCSPISSRICMDGDK